MSWSFTPGQLASSGSPAPAVVLSSTAPNSLDAPNGVAFDAAGDLWVADEGSDAAVEFSPGQLGSSGAPASADTIMGSSTGINDPWVLAVAPGPLASIAAPANNATYTAGQLVEAIYSCRPGAGGVLKSGTSGCSGTVANGQPINTSTGTHAFSVTATDADGQTATATSTYTVLGLSVEHQLKVSLQGDGRGR